MKRAPLKVLAGRPLVNSDPENKWEVVMLTHFLFVVFPPLNF